VCQTPLVNAWCSNALLGAHWLVTSVNAVASSDARGACVTFVQLAKCSVRSLWAHCFTLLHLLLH
jgi:hypothetical protein